VNSWNWALFRGRDFFDCLTRGGGFPVACVTNIISLFLLFLGGVTRRRADVGQAVFQRVRFIKGRSNRVNLVTIPEGRNGYYSRRKKQGADEGSFLSLLGGGVVTWRRLGETSLRSLRSEVTIVGCVVLTR